ncbi:MAG TPA: RodZ domain-containing protein [Candidatus Saccharimonadia bacterium]|nr:RodZ domain-containing protein [Candidatus Saccharimonadia bacterium]
MSTPENSRERAAEPNVAIDQLDLGLGDDVPPAPRLFTEVEGDAEPEPSAPALVSGSLFERDAAASTAAASVPTLSLGARLRNAREARGLSLEQVARSLRIPSARLAEIEHDRHENIGAAVYVRGYLRSYARLVGLPEVVVTAALAHAREAPPTLVATRTISRSQHFSARYGTLLVYGVLTAVFVVPLLWAARQGALLPDSRPALTRLDAGSAELPLPVAAAPAPTGGTAASVASDPVQVELAGPPDAQLPALVPPTRPVMATMAPMRSAADEIEPDAAARQVELTLEQPSWVELIGADGTRIEYALLPAGAVRSYEVGDGANLRIGNTRGATLSVDGVRVDLAPHTRSNVARVAIAKHGAPR